MPRGGQMELALHWPILLQGSCGLLLIMRGRVLRVAEKTIALKAEFHEFRTAGKGFTKSQPLRALRELR